MRDRQRLTLVGLFAVALLMSAQPAWANETPGGDGGAFVDENGNPTAVARDGEVIPASGGSGASDCHWQVMISDDFRFAVYEVDGTRRYSKTGRWLQKMCDGAAVPVDGLYTVPEGGAVDPAALAADAIASVPIALPPIETSPSADRRLYVQVPTWLWLDPDWWHGYSATATAGRVTSTATAVPVRAEWTSGDGHETTCHGPGVQWRRGLPDSAASCSLTYRHSSAGAEADAYTLGVTVWFEVTWTSNTDQGGTLASIGRTASRSVQVGEIQAIETE